MTQQTFKFRKPRKVNRLFEVLRGENGISLENCRFVGACRWGEARIYGRVSIVTFDDENVCAIMQKRRIGLVEASKHEIRVGRRQSGGKTACCGKLRCLFAINPICNVLGKGAGFQMLDYVRTL